MPITRSSACLLLVLACLAGASRDAAAFTTVFEGSRGAVSAVLPLDDGGCVLGGTLEGPGGKPRAWVARLDGSGRLAWQHVLAVSAPDTGTAYDFHADVRLLREADGGLLAIASLASSQMICAVPETGLLMRFWEDGSLRDARSLASLVAVGGGGVRAASGGTVVVGDFHVVGVGTIPPSVTLGVLPDGGGDASDARGLRLPDGHSRPAASAVHAGGLAIVGEIASAGGRGPLVLTTDPALALQSCSVLDAPWAGSGSLLVATCVVPAPGGGLLIAGGAFGGAGPAFVARVAADGALQWTQRTDTAAMPRVLVPDGAGGTLVIGEGIALRLDSAGAESWTRDLGDARVLAAARLPDGSLLIAGFVAWGGGATPFVAEVDAELTPADLGCLSIQNAPPELLDAPSALVPIPATLEPVDRSAVALQTPPAWQSAEAVPCDAHPAELGGLRVERRGDRLMLSWVAATGAGAGNDVFVADLAAARPPGEAPAFEPVACRHLTATWFPAVPLPASAGFLVRARNLVGAGPLGFGSDGVETLPVAECP